MLKQTCSAQKKTCYIMWPWFHKITELVRLAGSWEASYTNFVSCFRVWRQETFPNFLCPELWPKMLWLPIKNLMNFLEDNLQKSFCHTLRNLFKYNYIGQQSKFAVTAKILWKAHWLTSMNIINTCRSYSFEPVSNYPAKQLIFSLLTVFWP